MTIISTMGRDYFVRKFSSAVFFGPEGEHCVLPHQALAGLKSASPFTVEGNVRAISVVGTAEKHSKRELILPQDFFDDMNKFSIPTLGYRTAAEGRVMFYASPIVRAYKKGVCLDAVRTDIAFHSRELMSAGAISSSYYSRPSTRAKMLLDPQYMSLSDGLRAMNDGDILSFALSPNLAIVPSDGENYLVHCKNQIIGEVTPDGTVQIQIPGDLEDLL